MVNGPRPSTLKVANSPAAPSDSPAAATSTSSMTAMSAARSPAPPVRSPTLLVRQATSMYSTCSTDETPLLRYGKEATPLQATWAEEPWDPSTLNAAAVSRASAPAVLLTSNLEAAQDEDYDVDMDDDTATTTTDTATPFTKPAISISAPAPSASGTTASDEQPPLAAASTTTTTTTSEPNHVTVLFRHNPYAFVSRVELYRCPCGGCSAAQQALMAPSDEDVAVGTGTDFLAAPIYPTPAYTEHHQYDPQYDAYNTYAEDTGMGSQQPSSMDATAAPHPVATGSYHYGAVEDEMAYGVVEAPPASSFMPPPPPPRIARRVIAESGEAGLDAEAAFYHIVMRWYNKVVVAQVAWVPAGEECPEPNEEKFTFDEWVDEVGRWWLRHFEHAQVKTTPSSRLLRSSYSAPVVPLAAASGAAAGVRRAFESHTSAAMPRKVNGTSGLTAELLDNHNQAVLPAPRSLRVRKELPW